jgi:hypothetical protein
VNTISLPQRAVDYQHKNFTKIKREYNFLVKKTNNFFKNYYIPQYWSNDQKEAFNDIIISFKLAQHNSIQIFHQIIKMAN